MKIVELWIPELNEETYEVKDYLCATVMFTQKKTVFAEGKPVAEAVFAVSYINETGKLVDVALEDCIIKTLMKDEKTQELTDFSKPRPGNNTRP